MNNYVPKFYQYPMPDQSPFEAAVKGTMQGMDAMSKLKSAQSDRDVNQQNIAASKQKMEQSAQEFPLTLEKTKADIEKIKADTSLTPYQKQLMIAQAGNLFADAAKTKAEIPLLGIQADTARMSAQAKLGMSNYYNAPATTFARTLNTPQMQSVIQSNPQVAKNATQALVGIVQRAAGNQIQDMSHPEQGQAATTQFIQQNGTLPINDKVIQQTLSQGIQQGTITDEDVKQMQKNTADSLQRKTSTAQMLNQRQYANILDGLFDSGSQLMPSVSQYAGLAGKGQKNIDAVKSALGETSPQYADYLNFTRYVAPTVSNEMRRTLGGQATDYEGKLMKSLSDPTYWDSNPDNAMQQWNFLVSMYKTKVNPALASSASESLANLKSGNMPVSQSGDKVGVFSPDGNFGYIPKSKINDAIKKGFKLSE